MGQPQPPPSGARHLLPLLLLLASLSIAAVAESSSQGGGGRPGPASSSPSSIGGFSSRGELPQMDFARLGAHRAASPSLCARVGGKAFFLCGRRQQGAASPPGAAELRDDDAGGRLGGSGLHLLAPGLGCLCQGHDGDVLAQVSVLRRDAERYQAAFGHPISARSLALRAAEALQGKGQQAWSRPPACITVIAGWDPDAAGGKAGAAELFQLDPVGLVFPVRGLAFGGAGLTGAGGEEDPTGEALNGWLAEGKAEGEVDGEGDGETDEAEAEAVVWRRLWGGMVACYPSLRGKEAEMECALVKGRGGFRRLGRLSALLQRGQDEDKGKTGEAAAAEPGAKEKGEEE